MADDRNTPRPDGILRRAKNWFGSLVKRLTVSMLLSTALHAAVAGIVILIFLYYGGVEELFGSRELNLTLMSDTPTESTTGDDTTRKKEDLTAKKPEADKVEPIDWEKVEQAHKADADKKVEEIVQAAQKMPPDEDAEKRRQELAKSLEEANVERTKELEQSTAEADRSRTEIAALTEPPSQEEEQKEQAEEDKFKKLAKEERELRERLRQIDAEQAERDRKKFLQRMAEQEKRREAARRKWEEERRKIQEKAAEAEAERQKRIKEIQEKAREAERKRRAHREKVMREWQEAERKRKAAEAARQEEARRRAAARQAELDKERARIRAEAEQRRRERQAKAEAAERERAAKMAEIAKKAAAARAAREARMAAIRAKAEEAAKAEKRRLDALKRKAQQRQKEIDDLRKGKLAWEDALALLKRDGLDIVIVFDSTESMGREIDELKGRISKLGVGLRRVVPKTRISVVTYRDRGQDYVVRGEPLTSDVGAVEGFLQRVNAAGGGDPPEAVLSGLEWAVSKNSFKRDAKKVILLFGDQPPHPGDVTACERVARTFRITQSGTVSTVTCTRQADQPPLAEFRRIAEAGGGESFLNQSSDELIQQLLTLIFGSPYRDKVSEILR